ncbi:bomanin Short 1-like [Drosophila ficusphila]|uniref:bomanin Short 1-like n=1 Tax=Drosophila ficusphila TaxID=30025 RepID=UPI001C89D116|nr:bomanin Short 1-like [Drosophila ficusphila]
MKFFAVFAVFVLSLLAIANAIPMPDPDNIYINGNCINCHITVGRSEEEYDDDCSRWCC